MVLVWGKQPAETDQRLAGMVCRSLTRVVVFGRRTGDAGASPMREPDVHFVRHSSN